MPGQKDCTVYGTRFSRHRLTTLLLHGTEGLIVRGCEPKGFDKVLRDDIALQTTCIEQATGRVVVSAIDFGGNVDIYNEG